MIPFLIFSLAAIGLNLLTGYTGLLSLGTGAFMGVGAYACYKLTSIFPDVNIIDLDRRLGLLLGRGRRGVRPAVAAHQGLLSRRSRRSPRSSSWSGASSAFPGSTTTTSPARSRCRSANCSASRSPARAPPPETRYSSCSAIVVAMTWIASNLVHGRIGRMWMAVRDMDIAAELMGIRLLPTKLLGLRGVLVLLRRGRRDDGVPLVRRRRSPRSSTSTRASPSCS